MAGSTDFWMYRWMDERGIVKPSDVRTVLSRPRGLRSIQEFVDACSTDLEQIEDPSSAIAAGRSMDLTGMLECSHWECLTQKVDGLFRDTWHYFDHIVVEGPSASRVQRLFWESKHYDEAYQARRLTDYATALLKLREQGLDRYLIFREKPQECTVHFDQHVEEAGLNHLSVRRTEVVADLRQTGEFVVRPRQCDDHWHYEYSHPSLRVAVSGTVAGKLSDSADPMADASAEVFRQLIGHLTADVRNAKQLGVPLAAGLELHEGLLRQTPSEANVEDVALRLQLPVMQNLTAAQVLAFRESEDLNFERMRSALRLAVQEKLKSQSDPDLVAESIYRDVIEPELISIDSKLKAAQKGLSAKAALSLSVGSVTATVGVLAALPPVAAAGLTLAAATALHGAKYIDDKSEVELSDMYFLWQAQRHSHARRVGRRVRKSAAKRSGR